MKKTKMDASSAGFRPKMSLSAPHGGAEACVESAPVVEKSTVRTYRQREASKPFRSRHIQLE
jgi:hypothetical protein